MDNTAAPFEPPKYTVPPDQDRRNKLTLIVMLLSSPTMVLLTRLSMGMTPALTIAIALNLAIRSFKRSQPPFKILPFAVLGMMIGGVWFVVWFLSLRRGSFFNQP